MEKHQGFLFKCHKIFFPIFMILTSALTGALSEMKPQPCCSVWMDGGTTLYPSTPVERAVKALVYEPRILQQPGAAADQWFHWVLRSAKSLCNSLFPAKNTVNFVAIYIYTVKSILLNI